MKNKSDISVMLKEAGILFSITLVVGLLLGVVYELTTEPIRIRQEKAVEEACRAVFQEADAFEEISYELPEELREELASQGVKIGSVYEAKDSAKTALGFVIQSTSTQGYGGDIVLYVGVRNDGTLNDISILEISETAGLGMEAPSVLAPQFHDKKVDSFVYTKTGASADNEIDVITSATITTKAVTNAVNGGLKTAAVLREGGGSNE